MLSHFHVGVKQMNSKDSDVEYVLYATETWT